MCTGVLPASMSMYLVCAVLVKCQKRAPDALAVELHVEPPFPMSETWQRNLGPLEDHQDL